MFKKKTLKNKQLFCLLIIYTLSHIFLYTDNFYLYFLNPLFWLSFLIFFYQQELKLPKKKESNDTFIISIIFFILYLSSGFILGFNKSPYNYSLINIFTNLWRVILPICGIEIIRYKLIKSNKNFKILITIIIIISEINFTNLFISHNIIFLHYFISTIIPIKIVRTIIVIETIIIIRHLIDKLNAIPSHLIINKIFKIIVTHLHLFCINIKRNTNF